MLKILQDCELELYQKHFKNIFNFFYDTLPMDVPQFKIFELKKNELENKLVELLRYYPSESTLTSKYVTLQPIKELLRNIRYDSKFLFIFKYNEQIILQSLNIFEDYSDKLINYTNSEK